jgi:CRISPR/Cas system endoribonuclease Cas6 (RAMP superfamily)
MAAALENSYSYSFEDADQSMSEERKQHDGRDHAPAASHNTHSTHRPTEASHHASSHPNVAAVPSTKIGATDPAAQMRDRARVLNPVRESLAHSLLASQVLTVSYHTAAYLSFARCSL